MAVSGILGWIGGSPGHDEHHHHAHAIRHIFCAIGIPLLFTTVILTANFSVYLTSAAKVFFFMGILSGTGITTALVTDYFVTPVLLNLFHAFGPEQTAAP